LLHTKLPTGPKSVVRCATSGLTSKRPDTEGRQRSQQRNLKHLQQFDFDFGRDSDLLSLASKGGGNPRLSFSEDGPATMLVRDPMTVFTLSRF